METEIPYISIKNWAVGDRPREKLAAKGRTSLSDAELLAILLGSGMRNRSALDIAKNILNEVGNNINNLARLNVEELQKFKGIGKARAINIISAFELGRRREDVSIDDTFVKSSHDVYSIMARELKDLSHEEFWVILLNRRNAVIKKHRVSSGGIAGTVVDPRLIFKVALECYASALVLVHNHPSGNLQPSRQDIELTKRLKNGGALMDIPVLDHLIYTNNGYYSFMDEGMM